MTELLPTLQAQDVRESLIDFLRTTFALTDLEASDALAHFLDDTQDGIFKGPYVRIRLPFKGAAEGWRESLEWAPDQFPPYGHQAEAYQRLSSLDLGVEKPRPLPTLVTTGTGSGKTEAFLVPILDHVQRAKALGETGIKALILYPMNALVNDQADRLKDLILAEPRLTGIRAARYTGQGGSKRSTVSAAGLITDRHAIRAEPPDILLTNYKMLDQLLLRTHDQPLWAASATSLRYLVLDEFHSYDGAQGTDVAMLLRRLGLALKRHWPDEHEHIDDDARARPLGLLTPVATSATLGDKGDPAQMIEFAHRVFGEKLDESDVVTETRLTVDEWSAGALEALTATGAVPVEVTLPVAQRLNTALGELGDLSTDAPALVRTMATHLWTGLPGDSSDSTLFMSFRAHPLVHRLARAAEDARPQATLAAELFPAELAPTESTAERDERNERLLTALVAALGHVRKSAGRSELSIDAHLWLRSLTRVDRIAGASADYRWSDQVHAESLDNTDPYSAEDRPQFPAIYCRHCGRSGWGVQLAPTGGDLAADDADIRANHAVKKGGFRALIFAPREADRDLADRKVGGDGVRGLSWFRVEQRRLAAAAPDDDDPAVAGGWVLPVLTVTGDDVETASRDDTCPSCERADGIRFLGSAIATMLSVAVTSMFGDAALSADEKKAIVFTDSVQDAAHRAGFVQSRAHVFGFRNAIRRAVGDQTLSVDAIVDAMLAQATTPVERYRLLAPDIADRDKFRDYWEKGKVTPSTRTNIRRRLLLDVGLEFGLQSGVGRTLERTGSLAARVEVGTAARLEQLARSVVDGFDRVETLDESAPEAVPGDQLVQWVRGVLERMRDRGAIGHDWLRKYVESDGRRWSIWGGRPRGVGMPAFPEGRDAPGFPRIGPPAPTGRDSQRSHLDIASSSQSWFATWTRKTLGVSAVDGARLIKLLFAKMHTDGMLVATTLSNGAVVYQLGPEQIAVSPIAEVDLKAKRHTLECDTCAAPTHGPIEVIDQFVGAPCNSARCAGRRRRTAALPNYYRTLYDTGDMRRVVAREHTSLLPDETRLDVETRFKSSSTEPDAPNVLVATPTLEMGIDIGDLSAVMLAGLPRTVASYLQRVGRAGRLTGNALSLAFVTGRGDQLPKIGDPLSVVNGKVRAPATYLDAEQILQRQYTAFLIDSRSAGLDTPPSSARDVLRSTESGSFLGDLIRYAEGDSTTHVDTFIASFGGLLGEAALESLRRFATTGEAPGTSPLAEAARTAVADWVHERSLLVHRRDAIELALPELQTAAEHVAATSESKDELRSAQVSMKLMGALIYRLDTEPWVGALERFGLLPNYTLLDDSVRLDVSLSWIDPDSQEYEHDAASYDRAAGVAIGELAPGSKFYAQGLEISIDAVDLGQAGEAVHEWLLCPSCGFSRESSLGDLASCPRCGDTGIADAGQRLRIVELRNVSAEVRRDEATITDRRDERERVRFHLTPTVDIDPTKIVDTWYVESTGFGVKYLRDVTVRWLNLGRLGAGGPSRFIAGEETKAPLFRVCEACGKLDSTAGANSRREHRSWCPHRGDTAEHVTSIALSRSLRTQGVVLRLPGPMTRGDGLVVPSLAAAVRLGLRETIGGDPDHLRMLTTVDPELSDGSDNVVSLLIHDVVPGGSGYLADLADPERIRALLEAALRVLEACECQHENRAACHRCLLPFIDGTSADRLSRLSAVGSLRTLLEYSSSGEPGAWSITTTKPPLPPDIDSVFEGWFKEQFIARAKAIGTVKELPGNSGSRVLVTLGSSGMQWMLTPQVPLGATQPDFVLDRFNGPADSIAIYTDGYRFHASAQHNNIRSDAEKRRGARAQGYRVLAITWHDLQRSADGHPDTDVGGWYDVQAAGQFGAALGFSLSMLESVRLDPLTRLMKWMQDPDGTLSDWGRVAECLPLLVRTGTQTEDFPASTSLRRDAALWIRDEITPVQSGQHWGVRVGGTAFVARTTTGHSTEAVVALDDRAEALVADANQIDWRAWLQMSNVLTFAPFSSPISIVALSEIADPPQNSDTVMPEEIPVEWRSLFDQLTSDEVAFAAVMAAEADLPVPEVGRELGDGIPVSFVWEDQRLLAADSLGDDDQAELAAAGWTVIPFDLSELRSALSTTKAT